MLHFSAMFWFKERSVQSCFIDTGLVETLKMGLVKTWNGVNWNMNGVGRNMFQLVPIQGQLNYTVQNQATPPYLA